MITAARIRRARAKTGETQADFAARFGVNQTTIHRWEAVGISKVAMERYVSLILAEIDQAVEQAAE